MTEVISSNLYYQGREYAPLPSTDNLGARQVIDLTHQNQKTEDDIDGTIAGIFAGITGSCGLMGFLGGIGTLATGGIMKDRAIMLGGGISMGVSFVLMLASAGAACYHRFRKR